MEKHLFTSLSLPKTAMLVIFTFLTCNLFFAQQGNHKSYAINQSNAVIGICVSCSIQDPQNAVGNNENDYSSLKAGIGALTTVDQILEFPSSDIKKLTIGLGTGNGLLTVSLLYGVSIETFNGNVSNGDSKFVDSNILKIDAQTNKATIDLRPSKPYNKVKISLHTGLVSVNSELRIYYAHQSEYHTQCNTILPADPYYYYTFNDHFDDEIRQFNFIHHPPLNMDNIPFDDSVICDKGLIKKFELKTDTTATKYEKTISFWADIKDKIELKVLGTEMILDTTQMKINQYNQLDDPETDFQRLFKPNQVGLNSFAGLHHYSIKVSSLPTSSYDRYVCSQNVTRYGRCTTATKGRITIYIDGKPISSTFDFFYDTPRLYEGDNVISLVYNNAKIDDLLIYDTALTDEELKKLPCAYNRPQNCPTGNPPVQPVMKAAPAEDILTVSPNPTTGRISLDGNIPFTDADIFITNSFGKEVFRTKFISKTFELPSTLSGGVYLLTVQTKDHKTVTRKIILTR